MQVLFTQNVAGIARKGEVKSVKEGYFRNFLLPRKMAVMATGSVLKQAEKMKQNEVIQKERLLEEAKDVVKKIDGLKLVLSAKASKDKLYGSIAEKELIDAIEAKSKVRLEKAHLRMAEPIKTVGEFDVPVEIVEGANATIKVEVKSE